MSFSTLLASMWEVCDCAKQYRLYNAEQGERKLWKDQGRHFKEIGSLQRHPLYLQAQLSREYIVVGIQIYDLCP